MSKDDSPAQSSASATPSATSGDAGRAAATRTHGAAITAAAEAARFADEDFVLAVRGFSGTPEQIERQWYAQVYTGRGDTMRQLTVRAVAMGALLGSVLSLTNLYVGLKSGWGFGVSITACILSYAIWTMVQKLGLARTPMTILENNCMQSTASAAGYSTGSTLVSAFAAYILLNGQALSTPLTLAWVFFIALLGVTMAVPMKRQMINVEQLRFPSGTASAETLRALYSRAGQGLRAARALAIAAVIAGLDKFWGEGLALVDRTLERFGSAALLVQLQESLFGPAFKVWQGRTVMFAWDLVFVGAGALTGLRVCTSMLVSATLCWGVFVPWAQQAGYVAPEAGFSGLVQWTLWGGTACMVASGLLAFLLQWRATLRAFGNLAGMFRRGAPAEIDPLQAIETPFSWFVAGQGVALVALAWLAHASFGMPWWQSIVAVLMSFVLAVVACRVTGETDTTPIGAMGKVTQLAFGALSPGNVNVNLMAANITSGAAIASADLLTDLKSGYLLGAHPRKQFLAQFSGIFVGTVVTVLAFRAMVPSAETIGGTPFAAPAAQTWAAVARALSGGLASLAPLQVWSIAIGAAAGVLLTLLPLLFPRQQRWMPSAAAVGLAWVFHWYYSLMFFMGAVAASIVARRSPATAEEYTYPVAAGIIAGGSLMGVSIIVWENGPQLVRTLFGG